jgi:hypothetical protein
MLPASQDEVLLNLAVLAVSQCGAELTVTCRELKDVQCSGAGVK